MQIIFESSNSSDKFVECISQLEKNFNSILILSSSNNNHNLRIINEKLVSSSASIFGGVFPKIIYKNKLYNQGVIFVGFKQVIKTSIIQNISNLTKEELFLKCEEIYDNIDEVFDTNFIFIDGTVNKTSDLVLSVFENFGLYSNYIGSGCGNFPFDNKESIFTNKGCLKNSFILASSHLQSVSEVASGWSAISEPMKITYVKNNVILELDYENAYDKYMDILKKSLNIEDAVSDILETSMLYPLGVCKISGDEIAKTIIEVSPNGLKLAESIDSNKFINVLNSNVENLIINSKESAKKLAYYEGNFTFLIDCLSRHLIMKDDFQKELDAIYNQEELIGVLSLGEIANNQNRYLEVYNQSAVIAKIRE